VELHTSQETALGAFVQELVAFAQALGAVAQEVVAFAQELVAVPRRFVESFAVSPASVLPVVRFELSVSALVDVGLLEASVPT